jgi:hypothetical protein
MGPGGQSAGGLDKIVQKKVESASPSKVVVVELLAACLDRVKYSVLQVAGFPFQSHCCSSCLLR